MLCSGFSAAGSPLLSAEGGQCLAGGGDLPPGARGEPAGADPRRLLSLSKTRGVLEKAQGPESDPASSFTPDSISQSFMNDDVKGILPSVVMWAVNE